MINENLIQMLRCPQDRSCLSRAEPGTVALANQAIDAGTLTNVGGQKVKQPLDDGLVREAGDLMYPVVDEIPVMLPDEAIDVSQLRQQ